jgi:CubicO group peptidase (beta-lactamase class C family)
MQNSSLVSAFIALSLIPMPRAAAHVPLPRSTPEAQGISSNAVRDFVETADKKINTMHSFMLVRHGRVIAEGWWKPEAADKPHALWSLSKSFNSTAVGLAIEEGKLSLDDPVLKFFPSEAPAAPSDNLKAMKVRDLLTMTCGHETEPKAIFGSPSVRQFLAHPVPYKPGTHFQYNTMGSYTLSAIVTKVTGQTTLEYLRTRLFEPLGIENPQWGSSPEGNSLGGYGLSLCTEDIAKFGQLYLQKGKWNGRQLIPQDWIEQATSKQVPNDKEGHANIGIDWKQGYGFQFWRCTHNAFRGDGAGGQLCVVLPDQDAVVAITAQTGNFQGEMNAIWDKLLPAFHAQPLPEDAAGQAKLKQAIAKLVAHPDKNAGGAVATALFPKRSLFDGRTFDGWEGDTKKTFRIENGSIVGGSLKAPVAHNEFLCTRASYRNFILRAECKLIGPANGGIQFRSQRVPRNYEVSGYQADMSAEPGGGYWGCLYDESRRNRVLVRPPREPLLKALKPKDWNQYEIRCEGPRIRLYLNGVQTVDFTEKDDKLPRNGIIGLQIHGGGPSEAWYRNITLEELP